MRILFLLFFLEKLELQEPHLNFFSTHTLPLIGGSHTEAVFLHVNGYIFTLHS